MIDIFCSMIAYIILVFSSITIISKSNNVEVNNSRTVLLSLLLSTALTFMNYQNFPTYFTAIIFAVAIGFLFLKERRIAILLAFTIYIGVSFCDFFFGSIYGLYMGDMVYLSTAHSLNVFIGIIIRIILLLAAINLDKLGKNHLNLITILLFILFILFAEDFTILYGDDALIFEWIILFVICMAATQLYKLNGLYESEKMVVELKQEQEILLQREIQILDETYNVNKELYHDMHNHFLVLNDLLIKEDVQKAQVYLNEVYAPISKVLETNYTGNGAIDYLLNHKLELAKNKGIVGCVLAEFPINTNIATSDVCSILGNMIDNGIRGNESISKKLLDIKIRRINDMIIIKVINPTICKNINANLNTNKENATMHGVGLKSIERIAKKYDGSMCITNENDIFTNTVTLPFSSIPPK